jgi:transcriptional regulator with PAS, ATPase and Fis domain
MNVLQIKQRFGIIGNSGLLNRAIEVAAQVAPTDISVLITGESGTGKEVMPQIIHQLSARKHGSYIAVNCGAIPAGTIDSELFGHEKGSFTGAHEARKGYFEVANGGTIFLDEVAELPVETQVRLLRVLETGEFIKVGSSKVIKTNVRIVAATNVNIPEAIKKERFREDLFYRLNTVPIRIPSLRERAEDIPLIFRRFTVDFSEKYRMPAIQLTEDAVKMIASYPFPGNIRQLKNIAEQISVIEEKRLIDGITLANYLPQEQYDSRPMVIDGKSKNNDFSEREILYKVLFDMRNDITDLKALVSDMIKNDGNIDLSSEQAEMLTKRYKEDATATPKSFAALPVGNPAPKSSPTNDTFEDHEEVEETLSLEETEKELIKKALHKHNHKRKYAAQDLGISERTLYRKIKEYKIN